MSKLLTNARRGNGALRTFAPVLLSALLAGCASFSHERVSSDEAPIVNGPAVRDNLTPLDQAYSCYGQELQTNNVSMGIGVGDIRDYTGKISDFEGTVVTQGGALMAYSALGKLGRSIQIHERFDTRVAELELAYSDNRRLGDGEVYQVDGRPVPWKPYYGGTILQSDYYIVGGVTEVNYNIQSGGAQATFDLIGPRARVFTMNVGVDLRLVDTDSLVVVATSSLQKQITGYEVGFEIFKFFDTTLVDFNAGAKNQEPVQLGVRTTIELAILDLLQQATGAGYENCVADYFLSPELPPFDPPGPATGPGGSEEQSSKAVGAEAQDDDEAGSGTSEQPAVQPVASGNAVPAEGREIEEEPLADAGAPDDEGGEPSAGGFLASLFGSEEEDPQLSPVSIENELVAGAPANSAASETPGLPEEGTTAAAWRELALAWRELALAREAAGLTPEAAGLQPKAAGVGQPLVKAEQEVAALQWQAAE